MKILFIDTVHPFLKEQLEKLNYICDTAYKKSKSEIEHIICSYDGIIIRSRFKIDQKFIDKAYKLKFIARAGSGMENINLTYADRKNIKYYNAAEGNRNAVAEHAIGMLLSLFNNLTICDSQVRNRIWERELNRGNEISGKTIAIIGYGNNGSALAEALKGFKVKILAFDKYLKKYPYQSDMQTIHKEADIISLNIPLTKETVNLVNNDFINRFEKKIHLINTSRGKCVNTKDLVSALKKGKIKGACLDVLEYEDKSFEKLNKDRLNTEMDYLIKSKKTILSPHVAGWSVESKYKIAEILLRKITSDFAR